MTVVSSPAGAPVATPHEPHPGPKVGSPPALTTTRRSVKRRWPIVLGGLSYVVLAIVLFLHVWGTHPSGSTIGGRDTFLDSWFLSFAPQAIAHLHNPFFSDYANYPFGVNTLANSSELLLGLLVTPITVLLGPIFSFNVLITLAPVVSALGAYLFLKRFVSWRPAAYLGSLLYGFSPFMVGHLSAGHLNLVFVPLPPLIFLTLHTTLVTSPSRWMRNGFSLVGLVVAQFFISTEILAITMVVACVWVVALALACRTTVRAHRYEILNALILATVVSGVLLAYPAWYAFKGPGHINGPVQPAAQSYRSDLLASVIPTHNQALAPSGWARLSANFAHDPIENGAYLGLPLLLVVAAGLYRTWRRPAVFAALAAGFVAFVLSLGSSLVISGSPDASAGIPLPEGLLARSGLFQSVIPSRFSLLVVLFTALLLAVVLDGLYRHLVRRAAGRHQGRAWAVAGVVGVASFALIPLIPRAPLGDLTSARSPSSVVMANPRIPAGSVTLLYPYPSQVFSQPQAWQALSGLPYKTLGGYFRVPGADGTLAVSHSLGITRSTPLATTLTALARGRPIALTASLRNVLWQQLRTDRVQTVIAVPAQSSSARLSRRFLEELLGPPSERQGPTLFWYGIHEKS